MVGPNVGSISGWLPPELRCLATVDADRNCVSNPWDDVQFRILGSVAYCACQVRLRIALKHLYLLMHPRDAEAAYEEAAVLVESAHWCHVVYRIRACILDRKLLSKWAGRVS